jgi:hypothetical protein
LLHPIPIHFEWNSFALISACIADPGFDQIGRLSVYLTITPATPLRPGEVAFKTFCAPPYWDKHPLQAMIIARMTANLVVNPHPRFAGHN